MTTVVEHAPQVTGLLVAPASSSARDAAPNDEPPLALSDPSTLQQSLEAELELEVPVRH